MVPDDQRADPFASNPLAEMGLLTSPNALPDPPAAVETATPATKKNTDRPKADAKTPRQPRRAEVKAVAKKPIPSKRRAMTIWVTDEFRDKARRVAAYTPRTTISDFMESAIEAEYQRIVTSRGEDFPELDGELKKGPSIR